MAHVFKRPIKILVRSDNFIIFFCCRISESVTLHTSRNALLWASVRHVWRYVSASSVLRHFSGFASILFCTTCGTLPHMKIDLSSLSLSTIWPFLFSHRFNCSPTIKFEITQGFACPGSFNFIFFIPKELQNMQLW